MRGKNRVILVVQVYLGDNQYSMEDIHYELIYVGERTHWWYRVRRVLTSTFIEQYSPVAKPHILDIGCGTGLLLKELSATYDVHGIDISDKAVSFCKARGIVAVSKGGATDIPFPDNSFDIVLALDVIEHIKDDTAAAKEMLRVLKPGGIAIVFVPAFMCLWSVTDELNMHFRRYRLRGLIDLCLHNGFSIVRVSYFNFFLFFPIYVVRKMTKIFKIHSKAEIETGGNFVSLVLYWIFYSEVFFLKYINFPFGVSAFIIAQKPVKADVQQLS